MGEEKRGEGKDESEVGEHETKGSLRIGEEGKRWRKRMGWKENAIR